jgi:hypothetical protein
VAVLPQEIALDIHLGCGQHGWPQGPVLVSVRDLFKGQQGVVPLPIPTVIRLSALDECLMCRTEGGDHPVTSRTFPARFVPTDGELNAKRSSIGVQGFGLQSQGGEIPNEMIEGSAQVVQDFSDKKAPLAWAFGHRDQGTDPCLLVGLEFLADSYRFLIRSEIPDLAIERFDLGFCPVEFGPPAGDHNSPPLQK